MLVAAHAEECGLQPVIAHPERADEVVPIGAHLDSWHTSNGATDNGDGQDYWLVRGQFYARFGEGADVAQGYVPPTN